MSRYLWDSNKSNYRNVNDYNLVRAQEETRDLLQQLLAQQSQQQEPDAESICDLLIRLMDK